MWPILHREKRTEKKKRKKGTSNALIPKKPTLFGEFMRGLFFFFLILLFFFWYGE